MGRGDIHRHSRRPVQSIHQLTTSPFQLTYRDGSSSSSVSVAKIVTHLLHGVGSVLSVSYVHKRRKQVAYPVLIGDDDTEHQLRLLDDIADLLMSRFSSSLQSSMSLDYSSACTHPVEKLTHGKSQRRKDE